MQVANSKLNSELLKSAKEGDLTTIRCLLEQGADLNTRDPVDGNSLLHIAVINDYKEIVVFLVQAGMDVNVKNNSFQIPLQYISDRGLLTFLNQGHRYFKKEIIDCLLSAGLTHSSLNIGLRTLVIVGDNELAQYVVQSSLWEDPTLNREMCPRDINLLTFWDRSKAELDRLQNEKIGSIGQRGYLLWDFLRIKDLPKQKDNLSSKVLQGILDILINKDNFHEGVLEEEALKLELLENSVFNNLQEIMMNIEKVQASCEAEYPIYKGKIKDILEIQGFRERFLNHVLNVPKNVPSLKWLCLRSILDQLLQDTASAVQAQRGERNFRSYFFSSPSVSEATSKRSLKSACLIS